MKSPASSHRTSMTRRNAMHALLGVWLGTSALSSLAQPRNFEVVANYAIFNAPLSSHQLKRFQLTSAKGHVYEIFMAVPNKAPEKAGYPILYMLDGNAVFDRLTPDMLAQVPDMVIVGIGYPTPYIHDVMARSRDYTPPLPQRSEPTGRAASRPTGEAAYFLEFVQGDLRTAAENGLHINTERRAIWGHSYGGLFSLFTLLTKPDAFSIYIPVSPSVSWGDDMLQTLAPNAPHRQNSQPAKVLIMFGDQERRRNAPVEPEGQAAIRPNHATQTLLETLQQRSDLNVQSHVFEGLGHGATFSASFPYALAVV